MSWKYPPEMPGASVEVYREVNGVKLNAYIFTPPGHRVSDHRPAVLFFFGGGWKGGTPGQFLPLAGSEWVLEKDPSRLIRIPLLGAAGPITVKGVEWNLAMPAMGAALPDDDLAAVLSYMRNAWGNKSEDNIVQPVDVFKVKKGQ